MERKVHEDTEGLDASTYCLSWSHQRRDRSSCCSLVPAPLRTNRTSARTWPDRRSKILVMQSQEDIIFPADLFASDLHIVFHPTENCWSDEITFVTRTFTATLQFGALFLRRFDVLEDLGELTIVDLRTEFPPQYNNRWIRGKSAYLWSLFGHWIEWITDHAIVR